MKNLLLLSVSVGFLFLNSGCAHWHKRDCCGSSKAECHMNKEECKMKSDTCAMKDGKCEHGKQCTLKDGKCDGCPDCAKSTTK